MKAVTLTTTALFLTVTALIAAEFVPISLLTTIADDLNISYGLAGQTVTAVGLMAVLGSLLISPLFKHLDRRYLLLGLTLNLTVSSALIAAAQGPVMLFIGRGLLGLSVGGYWSLLNPIMQELYKNHQESLPKAFSYVLAGVSVATIIALPCAKLLGDLLGFRGVFWCLGFFAIVLALLEIKALPSIKAQENVAFKTLGRALLNPYVLLCLTMLSLGYFSYHIIFTYVRVFLEESMQVPSSQLSFYLLAVALLNVAGTLVSARLFARNFDRWFILHPLMMLSASALMLLCSGSLWQVLPLSLLTFGFGFLPVLWPLWLIRTMPDLTEMVSCLQVAVIQFAVGLAASAGGLIIDHAALDEVLKISIAAAVLVILLSPLGIPSKVQEKEALKTQTA